MSDNMAYLVFIVTDKHSYLNEQKHEYSDITAESRRHAHQVPTHRCFRLDGKFRAPNTLRPPTMSAQAPFSLALQPKLPL